MCLLCAGLQGRNLFKLCDIAYKDSVWKRQHGDCFLPSSYLLPSTPFPLQKQGAQGIHRVVVVTFDAYMTPFL